MTCTDVVREMFDSYIKAEDEKPKRAPATTPAEELHDHNLKLAEGWTFADGRPATLEQLVRAEPEWAASMIRAAKQVALDLNTARIEFKLMQDRADGWQREADSLLAQLLRAEEERDKAEEYRAQVIKDGDENTAAHEALTEGNWPRCDEHEQPIPLSVRVRMALSASSRKGD